MRRGFLHSEIRVHAKAARLMSGRTVGRARVAWRCTHKRPAVNILEATSKLLRSCLSESVTFEILNGTNIEDKSSTL